MCGCAGDARDPAQHGESLHRDLEYLAAADPRGCAALDQAL